MNNTNTSGVASNTTSPSTSLPSPSPTTPTLAPTISQAKPTPIASYVVETTTGEQQVVREGNASVVKIFTGEPFTAIPLGGSTGVFYIAARLESPFVFQSPLVSSENFSPYVSPVGASVVGLFPYGDVAVNVSTGVIQGWFTKPCDTSPLPIVTYILREETQLAAEVTDEDVANVTISANFTVYFQGYNREGVVDPVSGAVEGWDENVFPQMPSPLVSQPFWLVFNCAVDRSYSLSPVGQTLHSTPRVGAPSCFQYPQSPTFTFYATSLFFSIPFVFVAGAALCLLFWTFNWTFANCKKLCKLRKGKFQAPLALAQPPQAASNSAGSRSIVKSPVLCSNCIKKRTRPKPRDLRQKQNMEALRAELEELNAELNRVVEPPPWYCTVGACAMVLCILAGLVLGVIGMNSVLVDLQNVPTQEAASSMQETFANAQGATSRVELLSNNFDDLVNSCGNPGSWVQLALNSESDTLQSIELLSDPARFPLEDYIDDRLRVANQAFVVPAFIAFLVVTSLLLIFATLAVVFGCTTCRWGPEEVICTRLSNLLGGYLFTLVKGFCVVSWAAAATAAYLALMLSDLCYEPAFLEANVNVSAASPLEQQKEYQLYDFDGEFNLAVFYFNCQYGDAYTPQNPYANYTLEAAQLHLRISSALNESWNSCGSYTGSHNATVPSMQESYEAALTAMEEIVVEMSCADYGETIAGSVEGICIEDLQGNIWLLSGTFCLGLATLFSVIFRRGFVPNLYRISNAMHIHRHAKEKLELYLAASHSHNSSRAMSLASHAESSTVSPPKAASSEVDLAVT